ncbi:MAG: flagellar M-ring protein FliF [Proteobacteria bacterium]|nr:flagellar M-ring protein FliF [Desulfocapsa sp.]MBU3943801.1 flagellar M-ring protein FliF [Pseudomonadota bacterium]MCG2743670.1 flagellar M-ring protein FliF [Desulfobacteraceae bacterium]MBU4082968.1 flagellar M-ring protein FliF [Pseudomonadota bacterium]MBU4108799.1 flagellar M-ring protein FliF [Pseudomonadota bacterium]
MANENTTSPLNRDTASAERPERKNLLTLISEWPLSRKIALGAVALISIALFAVIIIQSQTATQQLLYANLGEADAGSVVNWLKGQKIPYQLKNDGKNIWVPADKLYETRLELAASGLPSGGGVGFEIFDKQSFALTDFVQKVNYTRALQGELSRTITSLAPVESTRVHLALPEKRLFENQQKAATASVIVTLMAGRTLDKDQVQGIIHLVAGSVTGMNPENVKIIDASGKVLNGNEKDNSDQSVSLDMLAFQQEVEHRMETRALELLDKALGVDNSMVRVTATLDFAKVEKTQELFDADDPVIRSEQMQQEESGGKTSGGVPGVESNLQGNTADKTSSTPTASKTSRTTNYEISKTISKTVTPVGGVTKLSVSILVADKSIPGKDKEPATSQPRTEEELKSLETMVSSALGLVKERGDSINIVSLPFTETPKDITIVEAPPANMLYQYLPFTKYGLMALGSLLTYFLLIRPLIKTMKGEVTRHNKTVADLEREQATPPPIEEEPLPEILPDEMILHLRKEIARNQVPTAYIIKNWIQEG